MMPWSTASLLCAPIDATHWTYLAEGGQNLLVRLDVAQLDRTPAAREQCAPFFLPDGGATLALRIRKRSRVQNNAVSTKDASVPEKAKRNQNQSETGSEAVDGESFRSVIVEPLLGGPANLPFVHRIPLSPSRQEGGKDGFLAELANKIEPQRPAKRKLMDEIDPDQDCVWAVEDLTAASGDGGSMLAFEIKVGDERLPGMIFDHTVPDIDQLAPPPFPTNYSPNGSIRPKQMPAAPFRDTSNRVSTEIRLSLLNPGKRSMTHGISSAPLHPDPLPHPRQQAQSSRYRDNGVRSQRSSTSGARPPQQGQISKGAI